MKSGNLWGRREVGTDFPKKNPHSPKSLLLIFHEVPHGTRDGAGICRNLPPRRSEVGMVLTKIPQKPFTSPGNAPRRAEFPGNTVDPRDNTRRSHFILGKMLEGSCEASAVIGLGVMPASLKKRNY